MTDLSGMKFGRLTVLASERAWDGKKLRLRWRCRCECGRETLSSAQSLQNGRARSCGCIQRVEIAGQRFGRLVAVKLADPKWGRRHWLCRCDCGNEAVACQNALTRGQQKSCGCRQGQWKHGKHNSPTYRSWEGMIQRCTNPSAPFYDCYGGRGITVCPRWRISFEAFLADMGERPSSKHSIDRKNNDGNYEKSNCRWANGKEQANNTSRCRRIEAFGVVRNITEWAEHLGINKRTLTGRLNRGWAPEEALSTPIKSRSTNVCTSDDDDAVEMHAPLPVEASWP